jgi:DNA-binding beta-propeller fold protein YncE
MKIWRVLPVALLLPIVMALPGTSQSEQVGAASLPSVVATVNVGVNPYGIGIDTARNLIYVSNNGQNTVSKIDGATLAVSQFSTLVSKPVGIAVDTAGNRLFVANYDQAVFSILNGVDGSGIYWPSVGLGSYGTAYDPSTHKAYVASSVGNVLYRVNTDDYSVAQIQLVGSPIWVAVDPSRGRAYVTVSGRQSVAVISTATDEQIGEYTGYFGTVGFVTVSPINGDIYVSNLFEGAVTVVDAAGNFKGALDVGQGADPKGQPRGIAINPNTGHIFVARKDTNQVYVFDTADVTGGGFIASKGQILVGSTPEYGVAVNPNTNRVYVGNFDSNTVSVIADVQPSIQLNTTSITFLAAPSGTASPQTLLITNPGAEPMDWNIAKHYTDAYGNDWLRVNPMWGASTPGSVTLSVDTNPTGTPLTEGTYTATLTITSSKATNSPQTVDVKLIISNNIKRVYLPATFRSYSGN